MLDQSRIQHAYDVAQDGIFYLLDMNEQQKDTLVELLEKNKTDKVNIGFDAVIAAGPNEQRILKKYHSGGNKSSGDPFKTYSRARDDRSGGSFMNKQRSGSHQGH